MVQTSSASKAPFFSIVLALCALLSPLAGHAQLSTTLARVTGPVDESALVPLKGNVSPKARGEFDRGPAPADTQLQFMHLVLSRAQQQQADLEQFIAEQQDPTSPSYHHWLTPQQFGQRFGAADSDVAALQAWLESHGFKVNAIGPSRTAIDFSGTVAQAEEAFHTSIHAFQAEKEQFLSNITDPQIPVALAPVIGGVMGLNTIPLRSFSHVAGQGGLDPESHRLALRSSSTAIHPNYYDSASKSLIVVPADAATIYDTPTSFNPNATGTKYDGTGVTIGIIGNSGIGTAAGAPVSPIVNYRNTFLGNGTAPTITNVDNTAMMNAYQEAYLDLEVSGGLAPGAAIHFYTASDGSLITQIHKALADNSVDILSVSFGACELDMGASGNQEFFNDWSQAATHGIAVVVSTGDDGSAGCDAPQTSTGSSVTAASSGLAVNGLASTPYNVAVGGTDFYPLVQNFSQYVGTTNSASNFYRSVSGYIGESPWNDSSLTFPPSTLSQNKPLTSDLNYAKYANIVAGSGGVSSCSTQSNIGACTGGYAKPSWQRGTGVPNDGVRDLPDVSLLAGNGFYFATWLVCTSDAVSGGGSTNCSSLSGGEGTSFLGIGGTSAAAPAFAGMLALVQQSQGGSGHRLGLAAKNLYDIYSGAHASTVFHDVVLGNNSVPCTQGTPNCTQNTAGYYYLTGYDTTAGYDLATGLGSVDVTQLINFWGSATGTTTPTITVTPGSTSITTNQSLTVTGTVSGAAGTPTGSVTLSSGSYNSSAQTLDSAGAYTFTVAAGSLAAGTDTLKVSYSGDATYAAGSQTATVTVTALSSTLTLAASATAIVSNQSMTVKATVTGTGPTPTGTVSLSGGGFTSSSQSLSGGVYTFTIPANSLSAGSDTLTVNYSGDNVYGTATNSVTVTVTQYVAPVATVTVTPATGTIYSSQSLNVAVTVTGNTGTPTGSVTLTSGSYTSAATNLTSGAATVSIPTNSLAVGTDTLKVTYNGDTTFSSASANATVTVKAAYSMTVTAPTAISKGGSATSTISITADASYTGTLSLTCALTSSPSGATDSPSCAVSSGSSITVTGGTPSTTATVTMTTTAAQASLQPHTWPTWLRGGSGAVFALLVFLGIPARRRSWRNLVGLLALFAALGSLSACGGGGSKTQKDPGTTSGAYVFTVTATGNPAVTPAPTATVNLTVN